MDELYELIVDAVAAYLTCNTERIEIRLRRTRQMRRDPTVDRDMWIATMRLLRASEKNDDIKMSFGGHASTARGALRAMAASVVERLEEGAKDSVKFVDRLRAHLPTE